MDMQEAMNSATQAKNEGLYGLYPAALITLADWAMGTGALMESFETYLEKRSEGCTSAAELCEVNLLLKHVRDRLMDCGM